MKYTELSLSEFLKLQGFSPEQIFEMVQEIKEEENEALPNCGNCAYYEADYPYKICHKINRLMEGDMGKNICDSHIFGYWDRYENCPKRRLCD